MEVQKTPRSFDRSRSLYERSVKDANLCRVFSIELDTSIENLRAMVLDDQIDLLEAGTLIETQGVSYVQAAMKQAAGSAFTDYNRVLSTANFARERLIAPLLFSVGSEQLSSARRQVADGTEGISVDLIASYLPMLDELRQRGYHDQAQQVRGIIQENTVTALLNSDQTSTRLAVPASTYDDLFERTDVYFYRYSDRQRAGYRHQVSVKSTRVQKAEQLAEYPDDIVIAAEEIGNLNLSVSRLLVKRNEGSPGLSDDEEARLMRAKDMAVRIVTDRAKARDMDELPQVDNEFLTAQLTAA